MAIRPYEHSQVYIRPKFWYFRFMKEFLVIISLLSLAGCAHPDAFHARDLEEPLKPRRDIPADGSAPVHVRHA